MVVKCFGVIHGKVIELRQGTILPDGTSVTVHIEADGLPLEDRRGRMRALCGSWAQDDSLDEAFTDIARDRTTRGHREVDLNGAS
ncbi:MAG: hypothetical protein HOP29_01855 [Phycisphaerales bacterium]|nr:hypothetical protein [Phycisphaerales bacterium]